jgi:hypothetical protein
MEADASHWACARMRTASSRVERVRTVVLVIAVDEGAHGEVPYLNGAAVERGGQEGELRVKCDALSRVSGNAREARVELVTLTRLLLLSNCASSARVSEDRQQPIAPL